MRAPDTSLTQAQDLERARQAAVAVEQREAAVCLAKQSEIVFLRHGGPAPHDLSEPLLGREATLEHDLDSDGSAEQIYAFTAADGEVYLSWREGQRCHLAWGGKGFFWQLAAPCGADGPALVCLVDGAEGQASCDRCSEEACHSCETRGLDVYCP